MKVPSRLLHFQEKQLLRQSFKIPYLNSLHVFPCMIFLQSSFLNKPLLFWKAIQKLNTLSCFHFLTTASDPSFPGHSVGSISVLFTSVFCYLFWNLPFRNKSSGFLFLLSNDHNSLLTIFAHNLIFSVVDRINLFLSQMN